MATNLLLGLLLFQIWCIDGFLRPLPATANTRGAARFEEDTPMRRLGTQIQSSSTFDRNPASLHPPLSFPFDFSFVPQFVDEAPCSPMEAHLEKSFNHLSMIYSFCSTDQDLASLEEARKDLKPALSYLTTREELYKIDIALQLAYHAHLGQTRRSGEPFVIHPIEVAKILASLKMDADSIAAGLLHDVVEDTKITVAEIESVFGPLVKRLVEGETKVSKLPKRLGRGLVEHPLTDRQVENLCHLLMAMSQDWRVLVIKLSDRLHNMRTMQFMPLLKQERTARETLDVFCPLAEKLGLWNVKTELEDISFQILHREEHTALEYAISSRKDLLNQLWTNRFGGARITMAEALTESLPNILKAKASLKGHDIRIRVQEKQPYHVWRQDPKLHDVNKQPDLISLKVIVGSELLDDAGNSGGRSRDLEADRALCYRVLDAIHTLLPPVGTQYFRDFVRFPKENGYQALHSVVKVPGFPYPVEIQVSTDWMNEVATHGLLALWTRSGRLQGPNGEPAVPFELPWLQRISAFTNSVVVETPSVSASSLIGAMKDHLTVKRFVLTGEGQVLSLDETAAPGGVCTVRDALLAEMHAAHRIDVVGPSSLPSSKADDVVHIITRPYREQRWGASDGRQGRRQHQQQQQQEQPQQQKQQQQKKKNDDPSVVMTAASRATINQKMWGARRLKRQFGGEVKFKEPEEGHGRRTLAVFAYWWLGCMGISTV